MEFKENTKESFDNYFNQVNLDLHKGYSEKFVEYLFEEFGDKWNFHIKFENEKYYPFTLLGNQETIYSLIDLPNNVYYYIKKRDGSYGRQIHITKNPNDFFKVNKEKNQYIIQKEIESELYNERKFDYRIYLLILKKDNKIRYGYYKKYVIRNCVNKFVNNSDKYSKITNHHIYSLDGLDDNFYVLNEDFGLDHKSKIYLLNGRVLRKIREEEDKFYNLLEENQFRILGVDYMVEKSTNKLYLIEINITPGVYYEGKDEEFFEKYNRFHLEMVNSLNNLIYKDRSDEYEIVY